jgi:hypothetical protein
MAWLVRARCPARTIAERALDGFAGGYVRTRGIRFDINKRPIDGSLNSRSRSAAYTTNERGLLHRWQDRDNPSLGAAGSVFLDGPDHA